MVPLSCDPALVRACRPKQCQVRQWSRTPLMNASHYKALDEAMLPPLLGPKPLPLDSTRGLDRLRIMDLL